MSFASGAYLLFLPLVTAAYWACPVQYRSWALLAASYAFYMGWSPALSLLLLGETALCWAGCLALEKKKSKALLALWGTAAFLPLVFCKYLGFLGRSVHALTGWPGPAALDALARIALPVGISFYTFQAVSCLIDVYRGQFPAERRFSRFALFVSFFPQLVAGPIERAGDLLPQLTAERKPRSDDFRAGARLLLCGFFRKICVADLLAPYVDRIFALPAPDGSAAALGAVLFGLQIYNDFAGYSEIALGSARLLGIRLTRNFREPYLAHGVRDFWRRWHVTLNRWFNLYVYRPLGGKNRRLPAAAAVFLLSGLWHGADWTFLCWGAVHGALYGAEALLLRRRGGKPFPAAVAVPVTFLLVSAAWVLFRAGDLAQAGAMYQALLSHWHPAAGWAQSGLTLSAAVQGIICVAASTGASRWAFSEHDEATPRQIALAAVLGLAIALCWLASLRDGTPNAFIYFQF